MPLRATLRHLPFALLAVLAIADASHSQVTVDQTVTGTGTGTSATSASITGTTALYLASISTKSSQDVSSVSGLGLTWTLVGKRCGGRAQTNTEIWKAQGTAATGTVTANLSSSASNLVIAVSRISGVDAASPIGNVVQVNSNGVNGSCSGGSDSTSYSATITTTVDGAGLFGAVGIRHYSHSPGSGYTELAEVHQGSGGDTAGVGTEFKTVATAGSTTLDGTISANCDWGVVAVELLPTASTTLTLADHAAGQQLDAFTSSGSETDAELFGFRLDPGGDSITVTQLVLAVSQVTGLVNGDWTGVEIVVDTDGDGSISGSETTTVGGAGTVAQRRRHDHLQLELHGLGGDELHRARRLRVAVPRRRSHDRSLRHRHQLGRHRDGLDHVGHARRGRLLGGRPARRRRLERPERAGEREEDAHRGLGLPRCADLGLGVAGRVRQRRRRERRRVRLRDDLVVGPRHEAGGRADRRRDRRSALCDEFGISSTYTTFSDTAVDVTDTTHYITHSFSSGALSIFSSSQPLFHPSGTLGGFSTLTERLASSNSTLSVVETGGSLTGAPPTSIDVRVSASTDDSEELVSGGAIDIDSSDLELIEESGDQIVGMRFQGLAIPPGTTITNAYIQFTVDETGNINPSNLTIRGEDVDDAATFTTSSGDISSRPTTSASVAWSPADWNSVGAAGSDQRTPDLSAVVQEIVDRGGWASGNDMVMIVTGSGRRYAEAYDGSSSQAPLLHVEFGGSTIAAGRRVYLPWGGSGLDINTLTTDGKTMMRRSLEWAAGPAGHWKLDDASGTTAVDSMGGHDGTLTGGTWTTGVLAGGLEFDGVDDYVSIPDDGAFHITNEITIAGWVYGDAWGAGSDVDVVLRKGEGNPNNWQFAIVDGTASLNLDTNDGSGVKGDTVLNTGQWYHVAGTWDGSNVRIYVDGVLDATPTARTGTIGTDTRPVYLGGRAGADLFDGVLDDVRLYNRALTADEIVTLATVPASSSLLMVVVDPASLTSQESSRKTQFEQWDYAVTLIDESDSQANFDTAVAATDVVYVSEEISSTAVGTKLTAAPVGVIVEESHCFDAFGITATDAGAETSSDVEIIDYDHYITESFATGSLTICSSLQDLNKVTQSVARGGQVLANFSGGGNALIALDAGGQLVGGGRAAGRRVFLPFGDDLFDWNAVTSDGLTMVQRSLAWGRGMKAHWKLDETAGTTAADAMGDHDATLTNMAPGSDWVAGRVDGSLDFDGIDDRAVTTADFTPPAACTIAFWMRVPGPPSSHGRILGLADNWEIRHVTTGTTEGVDHGLVFDVAMTGANNAFVTTVPIDGAGRWYHIAGTYDTATGAYKVYVNGELDKGGTVALAVPAAGPIALGTRTGSTDYWEGALDDVRIVDHVMGADEIRALYRATRLRVVTWTEVDPE